MNRNLYLLEVMKLFSFLPPFLVLYKPLQFLFVLRLQFLTFITILIYFDLSPFVHTRNNILSIDLGILIINLLFDISIFEPDGSFCSNASLAHFFKYKPSLYQLEKVKQAQGTHSIVILLQVY